MSDRNRRTEYFRLEAAARLVRLPPAGVRRYVRAGLIRPSRLEGRAALFGEAELARLRKIRRLREDLGLNTAGVEIALRLLDEIENLRAAARAGRTTDQSTEGGTTWLST
ncbi:MAG TPA: chaperone modulator CbpM [Chloroflexota bacterium]|jgi:DNA-binding transcriptional MerR regulator